MADRYTIHGEYIGEVPDTCFACQQEIAPGQTTYLPRPITDERARTAFGETVNLPFCPPCAHEAI